MKMSLFVDWLYLLRERELRDWQVQAALHGAKIGGAARREDRRPVRAAEALGSLVSSGAFNVERVKVSPEELERRRKNLGGICVDDGQ